MTATAFLDRWAEIEQGQRWTVGLDHKMWAIPAGPNSGRLIDALNHMATRIRSLSRESEYRTSDIQGKISRLSQLATDKVTRYQSCHCWLYHFFMRVIGRDPTAALTRLQSSVAEFDRLYKMGFSVETEQLKPLFEDRRFSALAAEQKCSFTGAFIQLLSLKETLGISNNDIVQALFSKEPTGFDPVRTNAFHIAPMIRAFLCLLKSKRNWTLVDNHQAICDFANQSFKRYFYHSTTVKETNWIREVGIEKNGNNYSLQEILFSNNVKNLSKIDRDKFWVTERAVVAYEHGNQSPAVDIEWQIESINSLRNPQVPERPLTDPVPTVVILQIEVPINRGSRSDQVRADCASEYLEEALLTGLKKEIQGDTFSPTKISAFVVPRLTPQTT